MGRAGELWVPSLVICMMISWNSGYCKLAFYMTPEGDLSLIKGSQLNLNCSINNLTYDVNKIGIGLGCRSVKQVVENCTVIPDDWLERIANDSGKQTLMIQKPNISVEDQGVYTCYYGIPPKWQHMKMVQVGELPSKPENISCISHNFNDLVCSASVRQSGIPMKWHLEYTVDGENNISQCTNLSNKISCETVKPFYNRQQYNMTLVGSNDTFNASVITRFNVRPGFSIVKPAPVADLQVNLTNISSEAIITWKSPDKLYATGMKLLYRVLLKESAQNWSQSQIYNITEDIYISVTYNLTNLIPHTAYTIAVSCKPTEAQGDMYWSDRSVLNFTTNIDIPGSSVKLLPGSFQYLPAGASDVNLTLYWKDPSERESHGKINTYKVQITETRTLHYALVNETRHGQADFISLALLSKESVVVDTEIVAIEEFTGDRENVSLELPLNLSSVYTVQVWAGNNAGYTDFPVNISIPPYDKVKKLLPSVVIVEYSETKGQGLVSWTGGYSKTENVSMVTWYSCDGDLHGEVMFCKDINWSRTHYESENNSIWVDAPESYKFAVALETEEGLSGGVVWQAHHYQYDKGPESPNYRVNADPNNHTILYITVTHPAQSLGGKPENYGIEVRKQESQREEECPKGDYSHQQPVNFSESMLLLRGLEHDTDYMICMYASNEHMGRSLPAGPVFVRTSAKPGLEGKLYLKIGIGVSVAIVIILLLVVLGCWCRNKIRSIELNNKIADVEVVVDDIITHGYRQTDEMRTILPDVTSIESHNLSDSGEGLVQDRRWSGISNNSGYSQGNTRRQNSSSGLSGYLRVDGDAYDLSLRGEKDSLIYASDDDDNDAEQGDTNECFAVLERKNVYHEIDDSNEFHNPGNCYIAEANAVNLKNDPNDTRPDTDTVPVLEVSSITKLMLDGENIEKYGSMNITSSVIDADNQDANIDTNRDIDKNEYVPNHQIMCNTAKDEYLPKENKTFEPVTLKSKSVTSMEDDSYHQNDGSTLSVSEKFSKSGTADSPTGFIQMKTVVPDQDDNTRQNDAGVVEAGDNGCNFAEITAESNSIDQEMCWVVEEADSSGGGEHVIEQRENNNTENMEGRHDTYCNPDSISIGEESLDGECAVPQNDDVNIVTNGKIEDEKAIELKTLSKTLQLHSGKENGRKIITVDNDLSSLQQINHDSSDLRGLAAQEQRMLDVDYKPFKAESGQSSDTYVCARINHSV